MLICTSDPSETIATVTRAVALRQALAMFRGAHPDRRPDRPTARVGLVLAFGVLAALVLGTQIASGASQTGRRSLSGIPTAAGTYSACYSVATGALRLVPASRRCRSGERRAVWSVRGPRGVEGAQGATGAAGPQGERGPTGERGLRGATGPAGQAGPQGAAGADGATGPAGPQGPAGADGAMGTAGPSGPAGPPGADGSNGEDGAAGPAGPAGPVGAAGPAGPAGSMGPPGSTGPAGPAGPTGAAGPTGPAGPAGAQVVIGTPVTTAANAARNVLTTATATCPSGKVLLGGGGLVTTTATQKERAVLVSSYPSASDTWTASGVVAVAALGAGNTMTVTAYALCSL